MHWDLSGDLLIVWPAGNWREERAIPSSCNYFELRKIRVFLLDKSEQHAMKVCLLLEELEGQKEVIGLLSQWAGGELSSTGEMLQRFGRTQDRWWTGSLWGGQLKAASDKLLIPLGIKCNPKSLKAGEMHWPEICLHDWKSKGCSGRG